MQVGSLVECIDSTIGYIVALGKQIPLSSLSKGSYYTIREIRPCRFSGVLGVLLEEISNHIVMHKDGSASEGAYNINKFREIQPPMEISINEIISEKDKV